MSSSSATRFLHRHARLFAVLGGGVIGATLRAAVTHSLPWVGDGWPVATLLINVAGAALLGFYLARRRSALTRPWSVDFWAIGLLGSLTTFSALSLEVVLLLDAGETLAAATYAVASPLLGLAAARLGDSLGVRRW